MPGRRGPRRTLLTLPLFLLALLGAPQAAAANATFHATTVSTDGAVFEGPLVGATITWDAHAEDPAALFLSELGLSAERAAVTLDRSERPLVLDAAGMGASVVPANETTSSWVLADLQFALAGADELARLAVWPLAPGSASLVGTGSFQATLSDGRPVILDAWASASRPDEQVPMAGLGLAPGGPVELRGDLRLRLSGITLAGTSDGGAEAASLDTRRQDEAQAGSAPLVARRSIVHEAFVDLHGAVLRLPAQHFAVGGLDAEAPVLRFEGATGPLFGAHADADAVAATGRLHLHAEPAEGGMVAGVSGRVASLQVGSAAVEVRQGPGDAWAWPLLAVAALLAGAYLVAGRSLVHALDRALGAGRYGAALRMAAWLRLYPWMRQDATLAAALSLMEVGRPAEAQRRLEARAAWSAGRRVTRDFLLARAAARLGDPSATLRHLAASLLADPALLAQARADPALAQVVAAAAPAPDRSSPSEAYA